MNRNPILASALAALAGLLLFSAVYGAGIGLLYVAHLIAGGVA